MKKRILHFNLISKINFKEISNESFYTSWFLSYCLLVSSAERFIVRSANEASKKISHNDELKKNLKLCFFQEIQHAEIHSEFNQSYFAHYPQMRFFSKLSHFINYTLIEKIAPLSVKIAAASAMEQLNAEISYIGMRHIDDVTDDKYFKDILIWHFVEEIEHRDCIFDLQKEIGVNSFNKKLGMLIVLFSFSFWITLGALLISLKNKTYKSNKKIIFSKNGMLHSFIQSSMRYLKKDYHPSQEAIPATYTNMQNNLATFEVH